MKAYQPTPATTKLLARFDAELMELLKDELKNYNERNRFKNNKQLVAQQTLTAAWSTYIQYNITPMKTIEPCQQQGFICFWTVRLYYTSLRDTKQSPISRSAL